METPACHRHAGKIARAQAHVGTAAPGYHRADARLGYVSGHAFRHCRNPTYDLKGRGFSRAARSAFASVILSEA
jgi:hypothetical protein